METEPNALGGGIAALSLVWLFGGFALSRAGVLSDDAEGVMLVGWLILTAIGLPVLLGSARGPLRALAQPPWAFRLDDEGIGWQRGGGSGGRITWAELGGVDAMSTRYGSWTVVRDIVAGESVKLFGSGFRERRTGWRGTLAEAVVAARADRYELMPHGRFSGSRSAVIRLSEYLAPAISDRGGSAPSAR
jgi:hypothetical protein